METALAIDRNLDLIINEDMDVIAYRDDYSHDMKEMVVDDEKWHFTDEAKSLHKDDNKWLRLICLDYARN